MTAAMLPAAPATAAQEVSVQFDAFAPAQVDALPGETVAWTNVSPRTHTVTALAFASADLPPEAGFAWVAGEPGAYPYHGNIHPVMTGEVDVRRVTLAVCAVFWVIAYVGVVLSALVFALSTATSRSSAT